MRHWPLNRFCGLLGATILSVSLACAQASAGSQPSAPPLREIFDYTIEWRLITAGKARLEWAGRPEAPSAGDVRLRLESAGLVSRLFPVDDVYSANLAAGFCAQSSVQQINEGSRHREARVTFDTRARKAIFSEKDLQKGSTATQETPIPQCVHDLIGGLMALRYLRIDPGHSTQVAVSNGKKSVMAKVEAQRREPVKTDFGTFNSTLYELYLFDNVLFRRSGHLHVWVTDDDRRLPIQLEVRILFNIGTMTFRMVKPVQGITSAK